jgi:Got1/Sft2-like family
MSKGVRELPGSFQTATSNFPSGKALMYFGLLLASGIFFICVAFLMFLPVMVLVPQKFAISFTLGCAFIIASLFALKGPANQFSHMTSKEVLFLHTNTLLDQLLMSHGKLSKASLQMLVCYQLMYIIQYLLHLELRSQS